MNSLFGEVEERRDDGAEGQPACASTDPIAVANCIFSRPKDRLWEGRDEVDLTTC